MARVPAWKIQVCSESTILYISIYGMQTKISCTFCFIQWCAIRLLYKYWHATQSCFRPRHPYNYDCFNSKFTLQLQHVKFPSIFHTDVYYFRHILYFTYYIVSIFTSKSTEQFSGTQMSTIRRSVFVSLAALLLIFHAPFMIKSHVPGISQNFPYAMESDLMDKDSE